MQELQFKPFEKAQLIETLQEKFPQYKVQNTFGNLQVRTSGFTLTGNVKLNVNGIKGKIKTQTNYDMLILFLIISFPIGIYIYAKKEKQKAMENEIVNKLQEILVPVGKNSHPF
ncbi:hypothetical protein [uncultured Maribacter sp.]|uniref:hypothetical protein n=1 Tax=uncultured Maribacter sp. TaxID=431308 RepID=UPI0026364539|nr:hypothetical protein [uncultured Maribacter sp.]